LVRDHINLLPENPLRGPNDDRVGPRFPDLTNTYDPELRRMAVEIAREHQIRLFEGVYSALAGPNLETPAEYEMLRKLGSDCTGMSSVPEALAAKHVAIPVMMLSMVSNVSFPPSVIKVTSLEDVIAVASEAEPRLRLIIREILKRL
jgi:purine-nucleoside phosphorylase